MVTHWVLICFFDWSPNLIFTLTSIQFRKCLYLFLLLGLFMIGCAPWVFLRLYQLQVSLLWWVGSSDVLSRLVLGKHILLGILHAQLPYRKWHYLSLTMMCITARLIIAPCQWTPWTSSISALCFNSGSDSSIVAVCYRFYFWDKPVLVREMRLRVK